MGERRAPRVRRVGVGAPSRWFPEPLAHLPRSEVARQRETPIVPSVREGPQGECSRIAKVFVEKDIVTRASLILGVKTSLKLKW